MARIEASQNRTTKRPKQSVKSVSKDEALSLIVQFVATNPDASLSQIGRHIERPKSTTGNYVKELTEAGAIHRNGSGWEVLQ
jgi:DNA-binding IclR family transcriptional regulator